jgi:LysR family transcriptional regulator (chromosome initiation inhibitor)
MRYRPRASAEFVARWFAAGVSAQTLAGAPVVMFDREDPLQDQYLRRRSRRRLSPPRCYVPGSGAFVQAVRRGLGWGLVPDLQAALAPGEEPLVEFDPRGTIDVPLYWQQWRRSSAALERVSEVVHAHAAAVLR